MSGTNAKKDILMGLLYGSALGEAIGLQFRKPLDEIISRSESDPAFRDSTYKLGFPYQNMINGFPVCDWGDKTDQLIVVMETLRECVSNNRIEGYSRNRFDDPPVRELRLKTDESHKLYLAENKLSPEKLLAHRLKVWCAEGFTTLDDTCGKGAEGMLLQTTTREGYVRNPIGVANNVWIHRNRPATNSCVTRSAIIGTVDSINDMIAIADRFCQITHPDPRCRASSIIMAHLIYTFTHSVVKKDKLEDAIYMSVEIGKRYLKDAKHKTQLDTYCYSTLEKLELNREGITDFCLRSLGAGIWALRYLSRASKMDNIFLRIIKRIVYQGGDASSNGSTAGALIGAWLGHSKLPDLIKEMPNNKWLNDMVVKYLNQKVSNVKELDMPDFDESESSELSESPESQESQESSDDEDYE